MAVTHKLIQTITVSTATASIDFTSIPATYTDIYFVVSARSSSATATGGVAFDMAINTVTTSRAHKRIYGTGATTGSDSPGTTRLPAAVTTNSATASTFGNLEVYFSNYAGSTNKTFHVNSVAENNSATDYELDISSGLWSSTAAITGVKFTLSDSSNFMQYSSASLYGIKNS
jgi:hypothetical protein